MAWGSCAVVAHQRMLRALPQQGGLRDAVGKRHQRIAAGCARRCQLRRPASSAAPARRPATGRRCSRPAAARSRTPARQPEVGPCAKPSLRLCPIARRERRRRAQTGNISGRTVQGRRNAGQTTTHFGIGHRSARPDGGSRALRAAAAARLRHAPPHGGPSAAHRHDHRGDGAAAAIARARPGAGAREHDQDQRLFDARRCSPAWTWCPGWRPKTARWSRWMPASQECVALLRSNFNFRGFTLKDEVGSGAGQTVARAGLRNVLPACLLALTDGARIARPTWCSRPRIAAGDASCCTIERCGRPTAPPASRATRPIGCSSGTKCEALARADGMAFERDGEQVAPRHCRVAACTGKKTARWSRSSGGPNIQRRLLLDWALRPLRRGVLLSGCRRFRRATRCPGLRALLLRSPAGRSPGRRSCRR